MNEAESPLAEPLRLVHHHPGRLRARAQVFVDAAPESPAVLAARSAAMEQKGVVEFSHNPKTGSIVMTYTPGGSDPDELLQRVAAAAGLRGVVHDPQDKLHRGELVDMVLEAIKKLNQTTHELTAGRADLREVVPVAFAAVAFLGLVVSPGQRRLPSWDSCLWRCYRIFQHWHEGEIAAKQNGGATGSNQGAPP
jgi:hypothetical protein